MCAISPHKCLNEGAPARGLQRLRPQRCRQRIEWEATRHGVERRARRRVNGNAPHRSIELRTELEQLLPQGIYSGERSLCPPEASAYPKAEVRHIVRRVIGRVEVCRDARCPARLAFAMPLELLLDEHLTHMRTTVFDPTVRSNRQSAECDVSMAPATGSRSAGSFYGELFVHLGDVVAAHVTTGNALGALAHPVLCKLCGTYVGWRHSGGYAAKDRSAPGVRVTVFKQCRATVKSILGLVETAGKRSGQRSWRGTACRAAASLILRSSGW